MNCIRESTMMYTLHPEALNATESMLNGFYKLAVSLQMLPCVT